MAESELQGYSLGQRHQQYNKLVQEAIKTNRRVNAEDFNSKDSDIINLINIDIASHNKNVEYILKVFTCNDMLYVSRAIKQSDWLINDQNYTHIINPTYLCMKLFPQMCTKAIIKLVKHIRSILKDQNRAQEFYSCEENPKEAVKWLPCCSLEFILANIANHVQHIKTSLLKRLCEKSITVLEIYLKNEANYEKQKAVQATIFLLPSNVDRYLDLVETNEFPTFNKKATTVIMKKCSNRVIEKFDKYYDFIHLPTFITCLKQKNIKDFLLNHAQTISQNTIYRHQHFNRLLLFIKLMPQEIRFEFVKEVFINKTHESKESYVLSEEVKQAMNTLCNIVPRLYTDNHIWYQFAPFDIAFHTIQEYLGGILSTKNKVSMLEIVLISAQNNVSHERTFLEYLRDYQKNIEKQVKEEILTKLIKKYNFVNYDEDTWDILNDIFKSIDVYTKEKKSEHVIIEAIILHNVIHKEKVSDVIEHKFHFNSMIPYQKKLSDEEKDMIFTYLFDRVEAKLLKYNITNENEFKAKVETLEQALNLLKDYKKDLYCYPNIICTIKDLVNILNEKSWPVNMQRLYNIQKTWRKLLFEESLTLCLNESTLLNALKHGPSLLTKNERVITKIICNDKMPLIRFLEKLKIYWPSSLTINMTIIYMEQLNGLEHHNATTRGLSILLPSKDLQEIIKKYTPQEATVDWVKISENELSIQQQFAKNMHISRPQPSPDIILQFAKGDYLQYALPSLLSIFYNLNMLASQIYIPNLLDAPVSLQKHGIRLAVSKFKFEQLLYNLSAIWKNNKNASIRSVLFKTVFELLCKERDINKIKAIWEVVEMYIDNITLQEDKAIYKLLFEVEKVPLEVRGMFYMKSYIFLHQLVNSGNVHDYDHEFYTSYTAYSRQIIEKLKPNFIVDIIFEFIAKEFTKHQTEVFEWSRGCVIATISSYLLCTAEEQTQIDKYKKVLLPILKQSFTLWNSVSFIRHNLAQLLNALRCDIKLYVIDMKKVNPHKMFSLIQDELKNVLDTPENYMLLTKWKLTATFTAILDEYKPIHNWEETCTKIANEFGNKCNDYLREDCNKYFSRIYSLFSKALISMLNDLIPDIVCWDIYKNIINDKTFIQGYLAAITLLSHLILSKHGPEINKDNDFQILCENICKHPSAEVKIYYYNQIKGINEN